MSKNAKPSKISPNEMVKSFKRSALKNFRLTPNGNLPSPTSAEQKALNRKLLEACVDCDFERVKKLVEIGANVNHANVHGETPLFFSVTAVQPRYNDELVVFQEEEETNVDFFRDCRRQRRSQRKDRKLLRTNSASRDMESNKKGSVPNVHSVTGEKLPKQSSKETITIPDESPPKDKEGISPSEYVEEPRVRANSSAKAMKSGELPTIVIDDPPTDPPQEAPRDLATEMSASRLAYYSCPNLQAPNSPLALDSPTGSPNYSPAASPPTSPNAFKPHLVVISASPVAATAVLSALADEEQQQQHDLVLEQRLLQEKTDNAQASDEIVEDSSPPTENLRIVQLLARAGGNLSTVTESNQSLLHHAVTNFSSPALLLSLLSWGCPMNVQAWDGSTEMHMAARVGNSNAIRILIGAGANVNSRNWLGTTALHVAIRCASRACVEALLCKDSKCDPNVQSYEYSSSGDTCLHFAMKKGGDKVILAKLVDFGARVKCCRICSRGKSCHRTDQDLVTYVAELMKEKKLREVLEKQKAELEKRLQKVMKKSK